MDTAADLRDLVDELSKAYEKEKKLAAKYHEQLLDTRHELVQKDITAENQKKALENARNTLERYETENKHLRGLLSLWI